MHLIQRYKLDSIFLPLAAILVCCFLWYVIAGKSTITTKKDEWGDTVKVTKRQGISADLPTPVETWTASKLYVTEPFAKRGELDQGILRFTWMSLVLVAQGYFLALVIGTPIGFFLGLSKKFTIAFDPIIQVLRPVSPLAWLPLGMILFSGVKVVNGDGRTTFG
ncbi:MAG: nitrate ABC transporter, permease protein, partial [Prosthecobacter sp.]